MGVVTKADLVEKDMILVEKLQMTSQRALNLPLGYVRAQRPVLPACLPAFLRFLLEGSMDVHPSTHGTRAVGRRHHLSTAHPRNAPV